ncbi:hypothetical protein GQ473_03305 [archaeon]|nr:hypothetical protein [archaeon]
MKKTILFALVILMVSASFAFAEPQNTQIPNTTGQAINTNNPNSITTITQTMTNERAQIRTKEELQNSINKKKQEMKNQTETMSSGKKIAYNNQNQVRLAVHTMLMMENMTGGIGKEVSAIAIKYNNSIQSTLNAEEKIQTRGSITRFFFGGDETSANTLNKTTVQNREQINTMNQLILNCTNCTEEVKTLMQEQIRTMEKEQNRLENLAKNELNRKGIFGWLYK